MQLLTSKKEYGGPERPYLQGIGRVWLAEAMMASGLAEEAEVLLENAERDLVERGEVGLSFNAGRSRARWPLARGDLAKAEAEFRRSHSQAAKLSMRPVCEACESELAVIAALQSAASLQRNVEV